MKSFTARSLTACAAALIAASSILAQPPTPDAQKLPFKPTQVNVNDDQDVLTKQNVLKGTNDKLKSAKVKSEDAHIAYLKASAEADLAQYELDEASANYSVAVAMAQRRKAVAAKANAEKALAAVGGGDKESTAKDAAPRSEWIKGEAIKDDDKDRTATKDDKDDAKKSDDAKKDKKDPPKLKQDKKDASMGELKDGDKVAVGIMRLIVPDSAVVAIEGTPTSQKGRIRTFTTPLLEVGKPFHYTVEVTFNGPNGPQKMIRQMNVQGGESFTENFTK